MRTTQSLSKLALAVCLGVTSVATLALAPQPAFANDTAAGLQAEDVFALEYASDPQLSPDGRYLIYQRNSNDIMHDNTHRTLWLLDLEQGSHTPLFADQYQYSSARWSPSGDRIVFVANRDGSAQLYMHWVKQNKTARISQLQKGVSGLRWSPDGQWLAFSMNVGASDKALSVSLPAKPQGANWAPPPKLINRARYQADGAGILEPSFRHIFVLPADGGSPRQLTRGDYQHGSDLTWRPDSQAILFSANRDKDWEYQGLQGDLYAVTLDGQLTQLTDADGREYQPRFSPDGQQLAYLSSHAKPVPYRNAKLNVMAADGSEQRQLASDFDRSVADYRWLDAEQFFIQYDDQAQRKVARLTLSGELTDVVDDVAGTTIGRPYLSGEFDSVGETIAYTKGSAKRPADIAIWRDGEVTQLTQLNDDVLAHRQLGEVHELRYQSSFDGEQIQGWYITPPDFDPNKKYPVILEIHGGPHLAYGPYFSAEMQRMAAAGYVVFYDNHRGSTSYGERFALLLDGKYSSKEDYADHDSGLDALIAKGFIDTDNQFIAGGSAGGIASAYAIGLTDRFNAAVVVKPVINWISKVLTADSYLYQIPNQFPGMPWDEFEHYWQRSPLSLVGNVTTPTMLMTGESDRRTPISETEQFYQALKLRHVDTVMVRIPGSPHGIAGKPSRLINKVEYTLAWFEKYRR
ncbi:S9 family peptidase [Idiomarina xiamenensis]|uniref:Acylaminoacyl peptidase n=1 Tax=Idiomarina xiamenensis 10-D-4 TaxID=740709 RepID=K2L4H7_9GAMM|nr:prolyl oligopeptidase family serine peptidase [Idiomarina xiamenensis]EKE84715.1 hypothetical protein A10D4_03855 [Idiomarina xiamenensis 10-D-4]